MTATDFEEIRKALMMRDAGYAVECDWELVGKLLKDHDRLRIALSNQEVASAALAYRP
jgi:hypothetical protein